MTRGLKLFVSLGIKVQDAGLLLVYVLVGAVLPLPRHQRHRHHVHVLLVPQEKPRRYQIESRKKFARVIFVRHLSRPCSLDVFQRSRKIGYFEYFLKKEKNKKERKRIFSVFYPYHTFFDNSHVKVLLLSVRRCH